MVCKAAIVNEEMEIDRHSSIFLFHVNTYHSDRLRRLLMQQILYEALSRKITTGALDDAIVLVDGALALTLLYPFVGDRNEYKDHFNSLYDTLYSPLVEECFQRDILLIGFLKRTGSTYLGSHLRIHDLYDVDIVNALLRDHGQHLRPIPVIDPQQNRVGVHHHYVTFYLNLKGWTYRFELLKPQEDHYREGVENLLFWATVVHYGMNPIFSKADEHARVTKREANLKFLYLIQDLPEEELRKVSASARKRTHFGYQPHEYTTRRHNRMEGWSQ
jgi:hypothetical protein